MVHQTWALRSTNQRENLHLLHKPATLQWRHPVAKGHWRRMGHQTWGLLPTSNLLPQCRHCHRTAVHVVQLGKPAHQIWHMQQTSHTMMVHRPQSIGLVVLSTALSYWPVSHLLVRLRATVLQTWDMLQTDLYMRVHTLTVDQTTAQDRLLLMAHQIWGMQQTSLAMMVHRPQDIGLVVHSTALSYWPVSHLLVRLRATVLQTWDMLQTDLYMRVHTLTEDQRTAPDSRLLVKVVFMDPVRVDHWKVMVLRTWGML